MNINPHVLPPRRTWSWSVGTHHYGTVVAEPDGERRFRHSSPRQMGGVRWELKEELELRRRDREIKRGRWLKEELESRRRERELKRGRWTGRNVGIEKRKRGERKIEKRIQRSRKATYISSRARSKLQSELFFLRVEVRLPISKLNICGKLEATKEISGAYLRYLPPYQKNHYPQVLRARNTSPGVCICWKTISGHKDRFGGGGRLLPKKTPGWGVWERVNNNLGPKQRRYIYFTRV